MLMIGLAASALALLAGCGGEDEAFHYPDCIRLTCAAEKPDVVANIADSGGHVNIQPMGGPLITSYHSSLRLLADGNLSYERVDEEGPVDEHFQTILSAEELDALQTALEGDFAQNGDFCLNEDRTVAVTDSVPSSSLAYVRLKSGPRSYLRTETPVMSGQTTCPDYDLDRDLVTRSTAYLQAAGRLWALAKAKKAAQSR